MFRYVRYFTEKVLLIPHTNIVTKGFKTMRYFSAAIMAIAVVFLMPAQPAYGAKYDSYTAMGDSVASGAGLGASENAACDRDNESYPYLVADSLGIQVRSLACSGAKANNGILDPQELSGGKEVTAQLDAAFNRKKPDLITMTIGANDARWTGYLEFCKKAECGSENQSDFFKLLMLDLKGELYWMFGKMAYRSDWNPPKVLLNGYYNPLNLDGCAATEGFTKAELYWIDQRKRELNQTLRDVAAAYSNVEYVPMDFRGHKVCDPDPWVQGPNDPAPLHPNVKGQHAIAEANLKVLQQ